jgi:hypothetical protein
MKTPAITQLTSSEVQNLLKEIEQGILKEDSKKIISDSLSFINILIEELKTSKFSIHKLKQLLGFRSELLKKADQIR